MSCLCKLFHIKDEKILMKNIDDNKPVALKKALIEQKLDESQSKSKVHVFVFDEIGSTNQWVIDNISKIKGGNLLCVAESQVLGRGRSGRIWKSPKASNVYMSFSCVAAMNRKNTSALSLVIGLAVTRVLKKKGVVGCALKWPNDILLHGKKLAGILIESKIHDGQLVMIVGIGINVQMPLDINVSSELGWTDLSDTEVTVADRNQLIANVYSECEEMISAFVVKGFSVYKNEWMACDEYAGKDVKIVDQGELMLSGTNMGVDDYGCLLVRSGSEIKQIFSGDVSLRINNEN